MAHTSDDTTADWVEEPLYGYPPWKQELELEWSRWTYWYGLGMACGRLGQCRERQDSRGAPFVSFYISSYLEPYRPIWQRDGCEKVDVVLKGCRNRLFIRNLNKEEVFTLVSNKVVFQLRQGVIWKME